MESKQLAHKATPLANYPHIKRVGDWLFVSGTSARQKDNSVRGAVPDGKDGWHFDIREQTRGVIENLRDILASCEATLQDLCEVTVFLVDMKDFPAYNDVYNSYFTAEGPTRTTVAVKELPRPDLRIEIKAIAYKSGK